MLKGTKCEVITQSSDTLTFGKTFLLHKGIEQANERSRNFKKFLANLHQIAQTNPKVQKQYEQTKAKFYDLMSNFEFLPNSPTLMNAGRPLQQLSACYVLPVGDSIEEIYESLKNMAIIHKSGGGTGFSFSSLRPAKDEVFSTKGISSGPVSFMTMFDKSTDVVKQGGTRRGANMGILRYDHPNIMDFIYCKKDNAYLENFNISVALDATFMEKARKGEDYELINPRNKEVVGKLNAKEVFDAMIQNAWETGDPGFVVIDRINQTNSNATPHIGQIESTNPCVTGDTLVSTEHGLMRMDVLAEQYKHGGINIATDNRVPIAIQNRDGTVSLFEQREKGITQRSLGAAFSSGTKEVFRLVTQSGYTLKATADHKIFTKQGWKPLANLTAEDEILIQGGEGNFNQKKELPFDVNNNFIGRNGRSYTYNFPKMWSQGLGQTIGWLIGDGWLRSGDKNCRAGWVFNSKEKHILDYMKNLLNNYYGRAIKEVQRKNKTYNLSYHSKYFVEFFEQLGVKPVKSKDKTVPSTILTAPKETVIGFLQGLFTADGTIALQETNNTTYIRLTSKSLQLLHNVQTLLLNLGIKSRIYNRSRKGRVCFTYVTVTGTTKEYTSDGLCYELQISRDHVLKYLDVIGFLLTKHHKKVKKLRERNYYKTSFYDKFRYKRYSGYEKVYDIQEPVTHSFIGNCIVVKNCGEQPLLPYEPCNLGSINLSKFVKEDGSDMDFEKLKQCVRACTHFLDNVIDVNNYPIEKIEDIAKRNRRIGLGVMGWAESLAKMRLPYNSKEAYKKAEQVMKTINDESMHTSEALARERGLFPNYKGSIFDKTSEHFRNQEAYPRNCARTTIAPTGTIGITAGLQGAGIEPFFAIAYVRYNAAGIDALKKGETPAEKDTFWEVNPLFAEVAEANNYFGMEREVLLSKIEKNHKSVKGIQEIPEDIQNVFLTAHDLTPINHVNMQVAFQKHTDNAVSKTVNLRNEATPDDVREVYELAYQHGAKGVTIYRDGSKQFQILNLKETKKEEEKEEKKIKRPKTVEMSSYYEIQTGHGPLHVHINYDEEGPTKLFNNISPCGTEISGLTSAIGIVLSKYFELGGDPIVILRHLNSIKGDAPHGFGPSRVDSIPHGISKALRDHLIKTGKLTDINGQTTLDQAQKTLTPKDTKEVNVPEEPSYRAALVYCPSCYSSNVEVLSGCSGPTCFDCGHSECS